MMKNHKAIRDDLAVLFKTNMTMMLAILKENKTSFGKRCYVTKQSMSNYLGSGTVTPMDFISIMYFANEMINEKQNSTEKNIARKLYDEIWQNHNEKGRV